ncbi:C-5 cytosine-specific DNA methylase [Streptomyces sp. AVP053U2]|nr:C-5 cytosine-specific DNA methylase [Streptomyces sp. AVP053U2]
MVDRLGFVDVCSGAGGMASGLESAGFSPVLLLDNKHQACETLLANRPHWNVVCEDLIEFLPEEHPETLDVDLLSAGLPRVKSSAASYPSSTRRQPLPHLGLRPLLIPTEKRTPPA